MAPPRVGGCHMVPTLGGLIKLGGVGGCRDRVAGLRDFLGLQFAPPKAGLQPPLHGTLCSRRVSNRRGPRFVCHTRSGLRVQDSGFRVQGSGSRVQGSGFRVQNSGFSAPEPVPLGGPTLPATGHHVRRQHSHKESASEWEDASVRG